MQIPTHIKINVHNGNTFIYFYHLTLQLVKSQEILIRITTCIYSLFGFYF